MPNNTNAVQALRDEAQMRLNSPANMARLCIRLMHSLPPEHPLAHRLFRAIKAYVIAKRQYRLWKSRDEYHFPFSTKDPKWRDFARNGIDLVGQERQKVQEIMYAMALPEEEMRGLTKEMGRAISASRCTDPTAPV